MTSWTVARQAPLSMGLSRQEYWSGLPFPPPGDLPDPGMEPMSPASSALAGGFLTTILPGKPSCRHDVLLFLNPPAISSNPLPSPPTPITHPVLLSDSGHRINAALLSNPHTNSICYNHPQKVFMVLFSGPEWFLASSSCMEALSIVPQLLRDVLILLLRMIG